LKGNTVENKYTLIQCLLSRLPKYEYPKNEKAEKRAAKHKHLPVVVHESAVFFEKKDSNGVVSLHKKGITFKRNPSKQPSKRDAHRNQAKEK
jgi:hypothetical protein